jgi:alkylation response protein AidB-like acyl-CoA dehydrogenase
VDFELTEDQLEIQRVVREVTERGCPASLVRAVIAGTNDGTELWKTYVELDWPSLVLPEEHGGMGFGAVELVLMLEELGRVVDPTPLLCTISQFLPLVRRCSEAAQAAALLGPISAGSAGAAAFGNGVSAIRTEGGWTLRGTARAVMDGDRADELAVVAGTDDGPVVLVVPTSAVTATRTPSFDATLHVADVALDGVHVQTERALRRGGAEAVDLARAEAVTGLASVAVGASQRAFDLALEHIRERKQFGVPIGSFQALKHMAADVHVAIERARALCQFAGLAIAEDDDRAVQAASMAKAAAGDAQRLAIQHSIQFFGGLGFTWENDLHLYIRRAKACELLLGTSAQHRRQVAREVIAR